MGDSRRKRSGNETQDDALADPPESAPKRRKLNADPHAEIPPGPDLPELPAEVWASILELLTDPTDVWHCLYVCKAWRQLTVPVKRRMDWELWWLPALETVTYVSPGTDLVGRGRVSRIPEIWIERRPFPWMDFLEIMRRPGYHESIEAAGYPSDTMVWHRCLSPSLKGDLSLRRYGSIPPDKQQSIFARIFTKGVMKCKKLFTPRRFF